jgi:hypothetical protein
MEIDTRCPVCKRLNEDGGHCFLKCKFVKQCWRAVGLEAIRCKLSELSSARQVAEYILNLKEEVRLLAIGLIWAWWDARNKVNVGEHLKCDETAKLKL